MHRQDEKTRQVGPKNWTRRGKKKARRERERNGIRTASIEWWAIDATSRYILDITAGDQSSKESDLDFKPAWGIGLDPPEQASLWARPVS
jgi:hypothetical protein